MGTRKLDVRRLALVVVGALPPLVVVTVVIGSLESRLGIQDGSAVYLLSVVAVAVD